MRIPIVSENIDPVLLTIDGGAADGNPLSPICGKLRRLWEMFTEGEQLLTEKGCEVPYTQIIAIALLQEGVQITSSVLRIINNAARQQMDRLGPSKFVTAATWLHGLEGSCVSDRIRVLRSWGRGPTEYDPSCKESRGEMTRMLNHHLRRLRANKSDWMTIELVIHE